MGALKTNEIPVALFGPPVGSGCHTLKGQWLPYIKEAVVAIRQGGSGCHTSRRKWLPYTKEAVVAIHHGGRGCQTFRSTVGVEGGGRLPWGASVKNIWEQRGWSLWM